MQTFLELLISEWRKSRPPTECSKEQAVREIDEEAVHLFKKFADDYLAANRPRAVDHRTADNLGVKLSNGEECLISPLASAMETGKLRNVDVVGVATSPVQDGGMDRVNAKRIV